MIKYFEKEDLENAKRYAAIKSAAIVDDELRLECNNGNTMAIVLTSYEYDALEESKKLDGSMYYIVNEDKYMLQVGDNLLDLDKIESGIEFKCDGERIVETYK